MGYAGEHSGNRYQQNMQSGKVTITTDSSGNGTATVTFGKSMKNAPVVMALAQANDTTGTVDAESITASGCTIRMSGSSVISSTIVVGWYAMDDATNNPGSF